MRLTLERDGPPQQALGAGEIPAPDRTTDVAAPNGRTIDLEGVDHDEIEALTLPEVPDRLGRAAALVAERCIGRHEQPGEVRPATDRREEIVVRRMPDRVIEVLDHRDVDAGIGQASEAFVGLEQERRGGARQDLVRMVVEGDDAWVRITGERLADEVIEQVDVSLVEPIEHTDNGEDRAVFGAQPIDAGDDVHHVPTDTGRSPALIRTLSGARRPPPAGTAIATSRPVRSTRR